LKSCAQRGVIIFFNIPMEGAQLFLFIVARILEEGFLHRYYEIVK